jgi:hypothetical protein
MEHPKKSVTMHHLCRLYCTKGAQGTQGACTPFYFHECDNWTLDGCLPPYICPHCKGHATYAQLTDEQVTAFHAIIDNPAGDPEEDMLRSGLLKTRKDLEAFVNHLWKARNSYPLMVRLMDHGLTGLHAKSFLGNDLRS